jgi:hypothetical protein
MYLVANMPKHLARLNKTRLRQIDYDINRVIDKTTHLAQLSDNLNSLDLPIQYSTPEL